MDNGTPLPWSADIEDLDDEEFRVIRAANGRPVAYIDKTLSINAQDDVARLFLHSPMLLEGVRQVFFAVAENGSPRWTARNWERWRQSIGPVLSQLWVTTK
jgi:hypothetical protein